MVNLRDYDTLHAHFMANAKSSSPVLDDQGQYLAHRSASFMHVINKEQPGDPTEWKCHISVAPEQMEHAWNIAADYLMEKGVGQFKVARPETRDDIASPNHAQAGKLITLYHYTEGPEMSDVLQGLEDRLAEHGIQPGQEVKHDRKIPGGQYSYYRNGSFNADYVRANGGDITEFQQYHRLSHEELQKLSDQGVSSEVIYNPSGEADPLHHVQISSPQQHVADASRTGKHPVEQYLINQLGHENIVFFSPTEDGFSIRVPSTFSRQNLANIGIDPSGVEREGGEILHTLTIKNDALPDAMQQLSEGTQQAIASLSRNVNDHTEHEPLPPHPSRQSNIQR